MFIDPRCNLGTFATISPIEKETSTKINFVTTMMTSDLTHVTFYEATATQSYRGSPTTDDAVSQNSSAVQTQFSRMKTTTVRTFPNLKTTKFRFGSTALITSYRNTKQVTAQKLETTKIGLTSKTTGAQSLETTSNKISAAVNTAFSSAVIEATQELKTLGSGANYVWVVFPVILVVLAIIFIVIRRKSKKQSHEINLHYQSSTKAILKNKNMDGSPYTKDYAEDVAQGSVVIGNEYTV